MTPRDTYRSYAHLAANEEEGVDYKKEVREEGRDPRVLVMAPHGGGIEPNTDKLAQEIAGEDFVFYTFRGLKKENNYDLLHITSTHFDEPEAVRLAEDAEVVLAVHGKLGDGAFAMVGGQHRELRSAVEAVLREAGIDVRPPTAGVAAQAENNICNRCQRGGVQLELSEELREHLQKDSELRAWIVRQVRSLLGDEVSTPA